MSEAAIVTDGLGRTFKEIRAVDGVSFEVQTGEIFGFLGPNGAGKSTTVHMLTTLLPPSFGSARVAGHDVANEGALVRERIGAALQEAALDPLLNGREHLRLQGGLHGFSRAERSRRAEELLERVGLTEAAGRKVGGYSGGMKRRLDLAMALVHGPELLFLDEPTTGLDIQSRTALWDEVSRLARDEQVTVFLTTQYLEEADVLADHIAIIDHGSIVAKGTPAELKATIGRATVEITPIEPGDHERLMNLCQEIGEPLDGNRGAVSIRLAHGTSGLMDVVRVLDREGIAVSNLALHEATLDDVFLEKTGRSLEGAGDGGPPDAASVAEATGHAWLARSRRRRARWRVRTPGVGAQIVLLASRSMAQTIRQPAQIIPAIAFPLILFAINAAGLDAADRLPGFPSTYLDFALAVPFVQGALFAALNSGTALAARRRDRLPVPAVAHAAAPLGADRRHARRRGAARRGAGDRVHRRRADRRRRDRVGRARRRRDRHLLAAVLHRVRRARELGRAARRLGRGDAGAVPALLRAPVLLVDGDAARPDRGGLVRHGGDPQPGLLPAGGRALA